MRSTGFVAALTLGAALLLPGVATAATAQETFDQGKALLGQDDFDGALAAFAEAARADRTNRDYVAQHARVRQAIELRRRLETEQNTERWQQFARALRAFYLSEGMHSAALALDHKMHARLATATTARMLAETQLAMERNAEAAEMLAALDSAKATPATQGLLVVALVRQGKQDDAQNVATQISVPKDADARTRYITAWMHAALGQANEATTALVGAFEMFAPSVLPGFKAHAKLCPELASLPAADLAKAMATESKIPESTCSGGKSCAGCPNRGKCAKGEAAQ